MNFKTTLILALVLTVGIAAVVLLDKNDTKQEKIKELQGRVLTVDKDDVTGLTFLPAGISCTKDSLGWKILQPVQTAGDAGTLDGIANMFSTAKIERTISSDPAEYAEFGLQPAFATLIVNHKDGADTLFVGEKSPTGEFVFARKSCAPQVFLTSIMLQTNAEKTLFDLRDKKVLTFTKSEIRNITLTNGQAHFTLQKSVDGWTIQQPGSYKADTGEIEKILNRMNSERAREFVDEAPATLHQYGLDKPNAEITLSLGNDLAQKTLRIGKAVGAHFYAQDASHPQVFTVDSSFAHIFYVDLFTLRDKQLASFTDSETDSVVLEFSNQTIVCTKDTAGTWTMLQPELRQVKSWKMSSLLSQASDLQVTDFVADKANSLTTFGLQNPSAKAKFFSNNSVQLALELGKITGDDVYAKIAGLDPVYKIEKSVYETLTPVLDDFSDVPKSDN